MLHIVMYFNAYTLNIVQCHPIFVRMAITLVAPAECLASSILAALIVFITYNVQQIVISLFMEGSSTPVAIPGRVSGTLSL